MANKATATAAPAAPPTVEQLVDELGRVEKRLEPHRLDMKREDQLRAEIRERFKDEPGTQSFRVDGAEFTCAIGERGFVTLINVQRAFKAIGQKAFLAIAKLSLKDLEATEADLTTIVSREKSGPRSISVFRKAA